MQALSAKLRAIKERDRLSQAQIARLAEVSQPTVQRALAGRDDGPRRGRARERLWAFVNKNVSPPTPDVARASTAVVEAFQRVWDGTEEHAQAIARVVDALAGMVPRR
jgi:transcriptional regulator with XRE-family HTH domain